MATSKVAVAFLLIAALTSSTGAIRTSLRRSSARGPNTAVAAAIIDEDGKGEIEPAQTSQVTKTFCENVLVAVRDSSPPYVNEKGRCVDLSELQTHCQEKLAGFAEASKTLCEKYEEKYNAKAELHGKVYNQNMGTGSGDLISSVPTFKTTTKVKVLPEFEIARQQAAARIEGGAKPHTGTPKLPLPSEGRFPLVDGGDSAYGGLGPKGSGEASEDLVDTATGGESRAAANAGTLSGGDGAEGKRNAAWTVQKRFGDVAEEDTYLNTPGQDADNRQQARIQHHQMSLGKESSATGAAETSATGGAADLIDDPAGGPDSLSNNTGSAPVPPSPDNSGPPLPGTSPGANSTKMNLASQTNVGR